MDQIQTSSHSESLDQNHNHSNEGALDSAGTNASGPAGCLDHSSLSSTFEQGTGGLIFIYRPAPVLSSRHIRAQIILVRSLCAALSSSMSIQYPPYTQAHVSSLDSELVCSLVHTEARRATSSRTWHNTIDVWQKGEFMNIYGDRLDIMFGPVQLSCSAIGSPDVWLFTCDVYLDWRSSHCTFFILV
jgi:hypothetical protein